MSHDPNRRLRQLRRVLVVLELIGPLRFGATIGEIHPEVVETTGASCAERTLERDLMALQEIGLVERIRKGHRYESDRWRLLPHSVRAVRLHQIAERHAEKFANESIASC